MVATSIHYIISVFLAWRFGNTSTKNPFKWGFIGVIPDFDGLLFAVVILLESLGLGSVLSSSWATMLFSHRGISHSLILLGIISAGSWALWRSWRLTGLISLLWGTHLLLDGITAWKLFPLLPFSYIPFHMGLVEVFDPLLTVISAAIFGFLLVHLISRENLRWAILGMVFILIWGMTFSVVMGEYNVETLVVAGILLVLPSLLRYLQLPSLQTKPVLMILGWLLILYPVSILGVQIGYQQLIGPVPISNIEPLEEFAFNANAHTYEYTRGDTYMVGLISYRGIEEERSIPQVIAPSSITNDTIDAYRAAYSRAIPINWINHPQWTFSRQENGSVYATITYAKQALATPHMPGPDDGIAITLQDDVLVRLRE